jgi:hypothetical protein
LRGKFVLAAIIFLSALRAANAQTESKNEIGLMLGGTVTPAVGISAPGGGRLSIAAGMTFQFNYARRLMKGRSLRLYFEVPTLATPQQAISSAAGASPRNYASLFMTPSLRATFRPTAAVSPWLSAGGGYALFDESAQRIDGTHNAHGTNGGAAQFGGGVDIRTPIRVLFPIGVRLELRDLYASKPSYNLNTGGGLQHSLVFSGGLVLRF